MLVCTKENNLQGMKICVTGNKGTLGQAFCSRYGSEYDIVGYDIQNDQDVLDYDMLLEATRDCEQIVHLAAISKPLEDKSFEDYFHINVQATLNVAKAAVENKMQRIVYASSTSVYGIERGIPFATPIQEDQKFISQYLKADDLHCRECDLSYHMSKVMAEQIMAWYGLNKKIQTIALRFAPIGKVFLGTSVSFENATRAIDLALKSSNSFWYEAISITDALEHIDNTKARDLLGYVPKVVQYSSEQQHS